MRARIIARMTTHDTTTTRIGIADVVRITGLSQATIRRRVRSGTMPAGTFLGERRKWTLTEIEQWIAEEASRPRRGAANLRAAEDRGEAKP